MPLQTNSSAEQAKTASKAARRICGVFAFRDRDPEIYGLELIALFTRYDNETVERVCSRIIENCKFPPAISEIREMLDDLASYLSNMNDLTSGKSLFIGHERAPPKIAELRRLADILPRLARPQGDG